MLPSWAKLAAAALVCVSLIGAPCKNCQPRDDQPVHDCCPKPKPTHCSWQPAAYDAVDKANHHSLDAPAPAAFVSFEPLTLIVGAALTAPPAAIDTSPPPTPLPLRI